MVKKYFIFGFSSHFSLSDDKAGKELSGCIFFSNSLFSVVLYFYLGEAGLKFVGNLKIIKAKESLLA